MVPAGDKDDEFLPCSVQAGMSQSSAEKEIKELAVMLNLQKMDRRVVAFHIIWIYNVPEYEGKEDGSWRLLRFAYFL